jgi:hypothetical protein
MKRRLVLAVLVATLTDSEAEKLGGRAVARRGRKPKAAGTS